MVEGDFRAGEALSKGFGIWFKNLPAFVVLAALVYSPIIAYTALVMAGSVSFDSYTRWSWVTGLLGMPFGLVVTAALLYGTIEQLRGRHAGIGESIGVGIKRLLPVLGVGLLSGLAIFAGFLLLVIPGLLVAYMLHVNAVAILGGFLPLLLIPALIVACMLYVAVPAAVVERPGLVGALRRSRALTAGHKMSIFGILLALGVIGFLVSYILQKMFVSEDASLDDMKKFVWVDLGVDIVLAALSATINGVVYHDLRAAKDGVGTEELARVFE
jgi:hypothetical protein